MEKMKISIEFSSIRDLLLEMPKFAQLIAGAGSFEERAAAALEGEQHVIKVTPKDGAPLTEEEQEKILQAVSDQITKASQDDENAAPESPKKKPKKNTDKAKKSETEAESTPDEAPAGASETEARAVLNGLVKSRGNAAVKLVFKKLGVSNFGDLKEASRYAEALTLAGWVNDMGDDEYEAALKDAGIKGGKK